MAIDNIYNQDWGPFTHDEVEAALKNKLAELQNAIQQAQQLVGAIKGISLNNEEAEVDGNGHVALTFEQEKSNWNETDPDSPAFILNKPTIPEAPTPDDAMDAASENTVQNKVIKAYVDSLISGLINGAPQALDTLKELADALSDNDDAVAALTTLIGTKQNTLVSGTNIKTVNNESILGNGNITIPAGQDGADGNDGIVGGVDDVVVYNNFNTAPEQGDDINVTGATIGYQMHGDIEDLKDRVDELEDAGGIIEAWVDDDTLFIVTDDTIAYIRANRSVVNFGDTEIGSSGKTVRLTITGKNLTNNIGVAVSGTGFSVDKQSITVQAGKFYAFLDVTFAPASGTDDDTTMSGSIVLTSGNNSATITLSGVAKTEVEPELTITPSTLSLSAVSGGTAQDTLTVVGSNLTPNTLLTITAPTGFTAVGNNLTTDSIGNVNGTITVTYTAGQSDVTGATLTVSDGTNSATATLNGTVATPLPEGAYFEINNIKYTVLADRSTVSFTKGSASPTGDVVIPTSVSDSGVTATLSGGGTQVGSGASYTPVMLVGDYAFTGCSNITNFTINEGCTNINGEQVFYGCTKLIDEGAVVFPSTLTTIKYKALQQLKRVDLSNTSITTFSACDGFGSYDVLKVPASMTSWNSNYNPQVVDLYMPHDGTNHAVPSLVGGSYSVRGKSGVTSTLHVPAGSKSYYEAKGYDAKFTTIEEDYVPPTSNN